MARATVGRLNVFINADPTGLDRGLARAARSLDRMGQKFQRFGSQLTRNITLPLAGIGVAAIKASADWETSLVNIAKTVDATDAEIQALGRSLVSLSEAIPVSSEELARIASSAGQLGIATQNILGFSRTVAALGVATNLGDEAASSLARLANITGTAQTEFGRMGAAIVDLGNNSATTEQEIVDMSLRIAGSGRQIGLTAAETFGFAAALSSLGIRSEAGGTAISRVFGDIAVAVAEGGSKLEEFARISGMTMEGFRTAFADDSAEAIVTFVEGLERLGSEGENLFSVLEGVGFGNIRVRDTLLRAASGGDLLRRSLVTGTEAWEENTALTTEADRFYNRLAGRFQIVWNRVKNLAAAFGDALRPAVDRVLEVTDRFLNVVSGLVDRFAALSPELRLQTALYAGLAMAIGPIAIALGTAFALFGTILAPIAAVGSALVAIAGLIIGVKNNWLGMGDAAVRVWEVIMDVASRVFTVIDTLSRPFFNFLIGSLRALGSVAMLIWDEWIRDPAVAAFKKIKEWAEPVLGAIASGFELLGRLGAGAAEKIRGFFVDAADGGEEEGASLGSRIAAATLNAFGTDYVGAFGEMTGDALERAKEAVQRAIAFLRGLAGGEGLANDLEGISNLLDAVQGETEETSDDGVRDFTRLGEVAGSVFDGFTNAVAGFATGAKDAFGNFVRFAIQQLARLAAKMAGLALLSALLPGFGTAGATGFTSALMKGLNIEGRASGGSINAGQTYLVGERGPELITPRSAGTVHPSGSFAGGGLKSSDLPPIPQAIPPDQLAIHEYYRRVIDVALPDWQSRGGRLAAT